MRLDFWKAEPAPLVAAPEKRKLAPRFTEMDLAKMGPPKEAKKPTTPFTLLEPMKGVVPAGAQTMAMDEGITQAYGWANQGDAFAGQRFMGYAFLAELTQIPEYRRISEVIAKEMTRKWIKFQAAGDESKSDKIKQLTAAFRKYKVRDAFRRCAEIDGWFGRAHLYLDTGATDKPEELITPLAITAAKIGKGGLRAIRVVEPLWTYPGKYTSSDPLKPDFYRPTTWYVMGKEIDASRLLTFVGREQPDLLKPAYLFGGLSLSQMARDCIELWLRDRESVSDLVNNFSVMGLKTNLSTLLQDPAGTGVVGRIEGFNRGRDNRGAFVLDKETEDFFNVSAPLGSLDKLQAQSQEHICAVTGLPLVIYTGITPAGLNASSQDEIRVHYDNIHSTQEDLFTENLDVVTRVIQLSEFGDIDDEITHEFLSLWELDDAGKAAIQKTKADTDAVNIEAGVIAAEEARKRQATDPESQYAGLDLSGSAPVPPEDDEEIGGLTDPAEKIAGQGAEGSESAANSGV